MSDSFSPHDHASCVADAIAAAEAAGGRLTPVRRRVLEILLERHRAIGAYDVLARLKADGFGSQPPVVYRALDYLVRRGLAHRIESLNAFIACDRGGVPHAPAFLICRKCDRVAEMPAMPVPAGDFVVEHRVQEAAGLCPDCAPDTDAADGPAP